MNKAGTRLGCEATSLRSKLLWLKMKVNSISGNSKNVVIILFTKWRLVSFDGSRKEQVDIVCKKNV